MNIVIALFLIACCSFPSAASKEMFIKEVPHSERSEAIFLYYQKYRPESTANPFNGTQQEHRV